MTLSNFRLAARSLNKQRSFTIVVVLSLALGIALNSTMYGVLDALIKPRIDVRDVGRLYSIRFYGDYHFRVANRARDEALATGMHSYESITRTEQIFGDEIVEHGQNIHTTDVNGVASNYFDVLGVRPLAGRTFIPSDESADTPPVVINETLAAELFAGGESPVNSTILIHGERRLVVGVVSHLTQFPGERFGA